MPDKADLPEVLRVPDVLLRRLSDGERLPLALVKPVRQCVAGQGDAVSSPAGDADGAQQSAAEACASRFAERAIAVRRAPRSSVRCYYLLPRHACLPYSGRLQWQRGARSSPFNQPPSSFPPPQSTPRPTRLRRSGLARICQSADAAGLDYSGNTQPAAATRPMCGRPRGVETCPWRSDATARCRAHACLAWCCPAVHGAGAGVR